MVYPERRTISGIRDTNRKDKGLSDTSRRPRNINYKKVQQK